MEEIRNSPNEVARICSVDAQDIINKTDCYANMSRLY
jgi:uncharacterized protein YfcZ (UPF0381/DUF406 family)